MPEFPDVTVYVEKLSALVQNRPIEGIRTLSFFLVRTANPPLATIIGKTVISVERMGKRIVFTFPDEYYMVIHLMIAGRFHWKACPAAGQDEPAAGLATRADPRESPNRSPGAPIPKSNGLAAFDFPNGTLILTESGTRKMASLYLVRGKDELMKMNPKGLELFESNLDDFKSRLLLENHTLKRALTDPSLFSGIGNAYSDEILHRARLSPVLLTRKMSDEAIQTLFEACKEVLKEWTDILRKESGDGFPEKVTAFHKKMAVHGKFGKPCPICKSIVQRIRYENNETDYCPICQTGGKMLADRVLSRLLKSDWPKTIEEWELRRKDSA